MYWTYGCRVEYIYSPPGENNSCVSVRCWSWGSQVFASSRNSTSVCIELVPGVEFRGWLVGGGESTCSMRRGETDMEFVVGHVEPRAALRVKKYKQQS